MSFDILTFYSPTHEVLFQEHFARSIQLSEGHRLIVSRTPQRGSGVYYEDGWRDAVLPKLDLLLDRCQSNVPFAYADCDIRWYQPTSRLLEYVGDCDLAAQYDGNNLYCTGLMVFANPLAVRPLIEAMRNLLVRGEKTGDQLAMDHLLGLPRWADAPRIKLLPNEFWSFGLQNEKSRPWTPGIPLLPPDRIITHHANWTKGIQNKLLMLEQVHQLVGALKKSA
ncbi:MAG: putative nucleotide-diphospho-sugar transferase [Tepidisphaeraceae bacterium]